MLVLLAGINKIFAGFMPKENWRNGQLNLYFFNKSNPKTNGQSKP